MTHPHAIPRPSQGRLSSFGYGGWIDPLYRQEILQA
jgi:hypothetical protein